MNMYLDFKQHVTLEDINTLSTNQKKHLDDIWQPAKGDLIANMSASPKPFIFLNDMHQPYDNKSDWELMINEKKSFLIWLPTIGQMLSILKSLGTPDITVTNDYNICDEVFKLLKENLCKEATSLYKEEDFLKKKITIITGDDTEYINKEYRKLISDKAISFENTIYLDYPESKKHIKELCFELQQHITEEIRDFVIVTFSSNVVSLIGKMISRQKLKRENVQVFIKTKDAEIRTNFDEDGFLKDYTHYLDF